MLTRFLWAFATLVVFVQASGDFILLHTPDSVIFKGNKEIDQSLLKEVFSAALGFTVKQRGTWNGMSLTNPFNLPEAVVSIAVEGVDSLGAIKGKKFPLNVDEVEETTWQALSGRLEERDNDNSLVRIYLGDGLDALGQSALGELKPTSIDESSLKALSLKNDEDRKFLEEIQLLRAIAKKVPSAVSADGKPDVYWLVVSGLKPVFDIHGKNSVAAKEALTLLNEALHDVNKAFMDAYKNQVLIAVFTNDASQVRHTRSLHERFERQAVMDSAKNDSEGASSKVENTSSSPKRVFEDKSEEKENLPDEKNNKHDKHTEDENKDNTSHEHADNDIDNTNTITLTPESTTTITPNSDHKEQHFTKLDDMQMNMAKNYQSEYSAIFNIILWFGVVFFFSLLAICITIAEMDPGRDSIIYRMTSNRMKKDN
ncbi:renin receptor isoform X1 [Nasonia vitripennis]|uniref:Renin receptor n=1 Tax=Nasonia vitripennis TaxID=7425 RepID=A0A7M7PZS5_NASVI|nr:renin receptor isoform X1 [Nasonia vitripennis]